MDPLPSPRNAAAYESMSSRLVESDAGAKQLLCGGKDRHSSLFRKAYPNAREPGAEIQFIIWCIMVLGREPRPGDRLDLPPYEEMLAMAAKASTEQAKIGMALAQDELTLTARAKVRKAAHEQKKANQSPMLGALGQQGKAAGIGFGRRLQKLQKPGATPAKQAADPDALAQELGIDRDVIERGRRGGEEVKTQLVSLGDGLPPGATVADVLAADSMLRQESHPIVNFGISFFKNFLGGLASKKLDSNVLPKSVKETSAGSFAGAAMDVPAGELLRQLAVPGPSLGERLRGATELLTGTVLKAMPGGVFVSDIVPMVERLAAGGAQGAPRETIQALVETLRQNADALLVKLGDVPTAWDAMQTKGFVFNQGLTLSMLQGVTREQFEAAVLEALAGRTPPVQNAELIAEALAENVRRHAGSVFHNKVMATAADRIGKALASLNNAIDPKAIGKLVANLGKLEGAARQLVFDGLGLDHQVEPTAEAVKTILQESIEALQDEADKLGKVLHLGPDELFDRVPWAVVAVAQEVGVDIKKDLGIADLVCGGTLVQDSIDGYLGLSRFFRGYYETMGSLAGAMAGAGASDIFGKAAADFAFDVSLSSVPDLADCIARLAQQP